MIVDCRGMDEVCNNIELIESLQAQITSLRTQLAQAIAHNDAAVELGHARGVRIAELEATTCEWSPIDADSDTYNTCTADEFHLTQGCELYPFCHWCGKRIVVLES